MTGGAVKLRGRMPVPITGSGRSVCANVVRLLLAAVVSGGLLGLPVTRAAAEQLEVPGPAVEYPAYTAFRLFPVARTRYANFARAFFAGEGRRYTLDRDGNPFEHAILAGRHRVSGGTEADLILMVVPLVRRRGELAEVAAMIFPRHEGQWQKYEWTQGFGTPRDGSLLALVSPVVGVTYNNNGTADDIDPPFWVPPMRDGRRTIIWNGDGMFWDGAEWRSFCWRRCGELG